MDNINTTPTESVSSKSNSKNISPFIIISIFLAIALFAGGYKLGSQKQSTTSPTNQPLTNSGNNTNTPTTNYIPTPTQTFYKFANGTAIITVTLISHAPTGTFQNISLNTSATLFDPQTTPMNLNSYNADQITPNTVNLRSEGDGNGYGIDNPIQNHIYKFRYNALDPKLKYTIGSFACVGVNCARVKIDQCSGTITQDTCTITGSGNIALSVDQNSRPTPPNFATPQPGSQGPTPTP